MGSELVYHSVRVGSVRAGLGSELVQGSSWHRVRQSIGLTDHWFDSPLIRQSIGLTVHWSDSSLGLHIGPTVHMSDSPIV